MRARQVSSVRVRLREGVGDLGHRRNVAQAGRARTTLLNWLAAAALGFALAASHHLDRDAHERGIQGHGWATDSATTLAYARAIAAREYRRELAALQMCASEHATVVWLPDGSHRCKTKHGHLLATVHQVQP